MLIRLIEIDTARQLAGALQRPVRREDCALLVTSVPDYARQLAAAALPCIYLEGGAAGDDASAGVYGVDLVITAEGYGRCADGGDWRLDEELLLRVWQRHYHLPWTIAQTERLLIRESVPEDLPELLAMCEEERGNPDVQPFSDEPRRELEAYIERRYPFFGYGLWSVAERATGRVVGRVGFEELTLEMNGGRGQTFLQLSYLIAGDVRRKGYGKEAARAALCYARENLAPARLVLVTSGGNTASRRLAGALGFRAAEDLENFLLNSLDKRSVYVYDL